jgi:DNA primase
MAFYGDDQISRLKNLANIEDFIGQDVRLQKSGKRLKGLCPFHKEKTPSFFVNPDYQSYRCFGCGKHGDVFGYLIESKKWSFVEAVEHVASKLGFQLKSQKVDADQLARRETLYKANKVAADFFHYQLTQQKGGAGVLDYLGERGIETATIEQFQLGYAPDAWSDLVSYIPTSGIPIQIFQELGLVFHNKQGNYTDRFRNRLMFSIFNTTGAIAGFGARKLKAEDQPKYINSSENEIYHKKEILYGLFHARDDIRQQGFAIFVEGYMDFLKLYQVGIKNVVATSGTALTPEHAALVRRFTSIAYMCYDSDEAGIMSTIKSLKTMLPSGIDVKLIILPKGQDPDSLVSLKGREAFLTAIGQAVDFTDYLLRYYKASPEYETPQGKVKAIRHILGLLALIPDPLMHEFFLQDISGKMNIGQGELKKELVVLQNALQKENQKQAERDARAGTTGKSPKQILAPKSDAFINFEAEKQMIYLFLHLNAEKQSQLIKDIDMELFAHPDTRKIFEDIFSAIYEIGEIDSAHLEEQHNAFFVATRNTRAYISAANAADQQNMLALEKDIIYQLKKARLLRAKERLQHQSKSLDANSTDYRETMLKIMNLQREISRLNP